MTFVADESVERQIVEAIRSLGYSLLAIAESCPGIKDEDVLRRANDAQAVLLTADKDFGELVFGQRRHHHGVVLFRLAGIHPSLKAQIVASAIHAHAGKLEGGFCVISEKMIRFRRTEK